MVQAVGTFQAPCSASCTTTAHSASIPQWLWQQQDVLQAAARSSARPAARRAVKVFATSRVDQFSENDIIVSPSILSADFAKLGEEV